MSNNINLHLQNIAEKIDVDNKWTEIGNVLKNNDNLSQLLFDETCEDVVPLRRANPNSCPVENNVQGEEEIKDKDIRFKTTILNKILRLSPPEDISSIIEGIPEYKESKKLYKIVLGAAQSGVMWKVFKKKYKDLCSNQTDAFRRAVFSIRHSKTGHTILTAGAGCRDPPLSEIEAIRDEYREALFLFDYTHGFIPIQHAIKSSKSANLLKLLIPTEDDLKDNAILQQHDFINDTGVRDRTLLHWAAYYNAPLEMITLLKDSCSEEVLSKRDHCEHVPYETAIWHGRAVHVIEEFFLPGSKGHDDFESVLATMIKSVINKDIKIGKDKKAVDQAVKEGKIFTMNNYDLPSIAKHIAQSNKLQDVVVNMALKRHPTSAKVFDLVICILHIISYRICAGDVLLGYDISWSPWLWVFTGAVVCRAIIELIELYTLHIHWFLSSWNYFDTLTIIFTIISLYEMWSGNHGESFGTLAVVTTAFLWFELIFFLRSTFINFAAFVSGIVKIVLDLVPFFTVCIVVLMMFGEMFRLDKIANGGCPDEYNSTKVSGTVDKYCGFAGATTSTIALFINGIDIEEFTDTNTMHYISMLFGLFVTIILLNVVIAVVSQSWRDAMDESMDLFWQHRVEFLVQVKRYQQFWTIFDVRPGHKQWKLLTTIDESFHCLFMPLWPSSEYGGKFDSFVARMMSDADDNGSFRWAMRYECTRAENTTNNAFIIVKGFILFILCCIIGVVWFIAGLATLGLAWPRYYPYVLFGYTSVHKKVHSDTEDKIMYKISDTLDRVEKMVALQSPE